MKKLIALIIIIMIAFSIGCVNSPFGNEVSNSSAPTRDPVIIETNSPEPTPELTQQISETPTEEPTECPSEVPTEAPTETPLVTSEYKCRVKELNLRAAPDLESEVVGRIYYEDRIQVIGPENDQFIKALYNGQVCYCYSNYLVPANEELYGYMPKQYDYERDKDGKIVYESDGVTPVTLTSELIDIRLVVPNVEIYQIFGTDENFTGRVTGIDPQTQRVNVVVPMLKRETAVDVAYDEVVRED